MRLSRRCPFISIRFGSGFAILSMCTDCPTEHNSVSLFGALSPFRRGDGRSSRWRWAQSRAMAHAAHRGQQDADRHRGPGGNVPKLPRASEPEVDSDSARSLPVTVAGHSVAVGGTRLTCHWQRAAFYCPNSSPGVSRRRARGLDERRTSGRLRTRSLTRKFLLKKGSRVPYCYV